MNELKQTPFYEFHTGFNAKMVDFAGYLMPVSYKGINFEHQIVREKLGVFDVSHMGEFFIEGGGAEAFLQNLTINDVSALEDGQAQYSAMCYENGGIVDDLLIYRFSKDKFMMVVNASNIDKDFSWAQTHLLPNVKLTNRSDEFALLAIQGPNSRELLQKLTNVKLQEIGFYHFAEGELAGKSMIISRTGYTGELGFELYHSPKDSKDLWQALFDFGAEMGLEPIGLAARDTLRLEMKYCLYGNDIDETTNPLEAGLGWITKLDKGNFIGRNALLQVKNNKVSRKLIGFRMLERAIPRHGCSVYVNGEKAGIVTSGTHSPTLKEAIGLAYVPASHSKAGMELSIEIRGKQFLAKIVKTPFVNSSPY
ncbi:MAG TPA: glycine cleavage system aminomethyltransferase GcvT [Candidatus Marinimicrobia bacterium]|nr:glycine cleavage system aminomethyltransferase GcvT [Candidatus Neomarinimicrobiota bacterium]